jgi:hypothetical protein
VFFLPGHLYDEVLDGGVGTSNNFWKGKKSTKVLWHTNLHYISRLLTFTPKSGYF